jgi:hypothetical protein
MRLRPPHCSVLLPVQADVHSPGVEIGMDVKVLEQRQSRPYSTAKYLYGARGVVGVLSVQNLLVCERDFSTSTGMMVCLRFATLLCQICTAIDYWASQQAMGRGCRLETTEVQVVGEKSCECRIWLIRRQQTAQEQFRTFFVRCKSLALHNNDKT